MDKWSLAREAEPLSVVATRHNRAGIERDRRNAEKQAAENGLVAKLGHHRPARRFVDPVPFNCDGDVPFAWNGNITGNFGVSDE